MPNAALQSWPLRSYDRTRTANHVADGADFRATIDASKPGTETSAPSDALYTTAAGVVAVSVVMKAAATLTAVHAAPVGFVAIHVAPVGYIY